jgi:hypothetical protein
LQKCSFPFPGPYVTEPSQHVLRRIRIGLLVIAHPWLFIVMLLAALAQRTPLFPLTPRLNAALLKHHYHLLSNEVFILCGDLSGGLGIYWEHFYGGSHGR